VEWDGENNVAVYQYDNMGRRTLERREGLNGSEAEETSFVYDGLSRLVKTVDAKGNEAVTEYDPFGDRVATYDPAAPDVPLTQRHRTGYEYDLNGRLLAVTDALGNTTHYEYDLLGNQTAVVDARGGRTEYDYVYIGSRAEAGGNARHSLKRQGKGFHRDVCFSPIWGTSSPPVASIVGPAGGRLVLGSMSCSPLM